MDEHRQNGNGVTCTFKLLAMTGYGYVKKHLDMSDLSQGQCEHLIKGKWHNKYLKELHTPEGIATKELVKDPVTEQGEIECQKCKHYSKTFITAMLKSIMCKRVQNHQRNVLPVPKLQLAEESRYKCPS